MSSGSKLVSKPLARSGLGSRTTTTAKISNPTSSSEKRSKTGCSSCKRKHIKCGEERPSCQNCRLKARQCIYPKRAVIERRPAPLIPLANISDFSTTSKQDLRAFHHFLLFASPSLPLGNRSAWTTDIPQIAQEHDYLMHSILALGASHLWRSTADSSFRCQALKHRGHAITGLKVAMSGLDGWQAHGQIDAMLGTCYTLVYQASHMPDAFQDYTTFVDGCAIITQRIRDAKIGTALNVALDRHYHTIGPGLRSILGEETDADIIQECLEALDALDDVIVKPTDKQFHSSIRTSIALFQTLPLAEGFLNDIASYGMWYELTRGNIPAFQEHDSSANQLLLVYLMVLTLVFRVVIPMRKWPEKVFATPPGHPLAELMQWVIHFNAELSDKFSIYLEWPNSILERIPEALKRSRFTTPMGVQPSMKKYAIQRMNSCPHIVLADMLGLCAELTHWFEDLLHSIIEEQEQGSLTQALLPNNR